MAYKDMSPENRRKIRATRKKYYQEHREELIRYAKTYNHAHQGKRKKVRRKDSGEFYIKWLLVSARSGGRIGIECKYKKQESKIRWVRPKEQLEWNVFDLGRQPVEKFTRIIVQAIAGERLLTM
jgi:hypothetical protein